jgi:hypothetical protein
MRDLLYVIALILIIGWVIGFVGFQNSGIIHVLLVMALIIVILRMVHGEIRIGKRLFQN